MKRHPEIENGEEVIYTKTIKTRNGNILHAATYGLNAFRIVLKKKKQ